MGGRLSQQSVAGAQWTHHYLPTGTAAFGGCRFVVGRGILNAAIAISIALRLNTQHPAITN